MDFILHFVAVLEVEPCQILVEKHLISFTQRTSQKITLKVWRVVNSSLKLCNTIQRPKTRQDSLYDCLNCIMSLCPLDGAFYLGPLKNPTNDTWYSTVPVGRNKLSKAMSKMCDACGIEGLKTNHSSWATAATCLYASGIDERLVMECTGHCSLEGSRSYKRTQPKSVVLRWNTIPWC